MARYFPELKECELVADIMLAAARKVDTLEVLRARHSLRLVVKLSS